VGTGQPVFLPRPSVALKSGQSINS
jgi:hypothetical protein